MQWKQFLTPVKSFTNLEAEAFLEKNKPGTFTLLDVRQPKEYKAGHIAGAKLIPVGELDQRLNELDADHPIIVYCAIGGRSRVAAQLLSGKGFKQVYNLAGGIKAWEQQSAVGPEQVGLELFSPNQSVEEMLIIGYGLEQGLRDFYLKMHDQSETDEVRKSFIHLADIELLHQERLLELYNAHTGAAISKVEIEKKVTTQALEGGMTTDEYLTLYHPDLSKVSDVLSLAMAIEAQALDLYLRASESAEIKETKDVLRTIAEEEREHIKHLAVLMDKYVS